MIGEGAGMGVEATADMERVRLGELYDQHWTDVVRLAYLIVGDFASAEDIVHEAFVRLLGRFRHLRTPEAFPAYLRATVVNLARNHLRARRYREALIGRLSQYRRESTIASERIEDRDELWKLLQVLPIRQRIAIVLRYYEELSDAEIAREMRCSSRAARNLLARGMASLRLSIGGVDKR